MSLPSGVDDVSFQIIDLNVTKPYLLFSDNNNYFYSSITLSKDYSIIYGSFFDKFKIFDISDPINPFLLGEYKDSHCRYQDIEISNDNTKLFLSCYSTGFENDSIKIFDISNVSNPVFISSVEVDVGDRQSSDMYLYDNKIFITAKDSFKIIDVTDINAPSIIGDLNKTGSKIVLSEDNTTAFILYPLVGVLTVDISNPSTPSYLDSFNIPSNSFSNGKGMALSTDKINAFIATEQRGFVVLSLQSKSLVGELNLGKPNKYAWGQDVVLSIDGTKAYIATSGKNGALQAVDISDVTKPTLIGSFEPYENVEEASSEKVVLTKDGIAILTEGRKGLKIIDVDIFKPF